MDNKKNSETINTGKAPATEDIRKQVSPSSYGGFKSRWDYDEYAKKLEEARNKPDKTRLALATAILVVFFVGLILIFAVFITDAVLRTKGSSVGEIFNFGLGDDTDNPVDVNVNNAKKALTTEEIAVLCKPSTVSVLVSSDSAESVGTGIVVTDDGYIITNRHVVDAYSSLRVVMYNNITYPARLVGTDADTDIAVLKIEADGLTAVTVGNSDKLSDGESIVIIGTPSGIAYAGSVCCGTVANADVPVPYYNADGTLEKTKNMIQLAANINYGNSGSPVFNVYGQVVGIVSTKLPDNYTGVGFAIPMATALPVVNDLIRSIGTDALPSSAGKVKIGRLGISVEPVTPQLSDIYDIPVGCLISSVDGLKIFTDLSEGDIIVSVNGIATPDAAALSSALESADEYSLRVYRSRVYINLSSEE